MSRNPRRRGLSPLLLGAAVLVSLVVAVLVGLNLESGTDARNGEASPAAEPSAPDRAGQGERDPDQSPRSEDPMSLGADDAPVVMVVYSDHMCPFCAAWERDTLPELTERYVDSGDLRIEARAFPYLGDRSHTLAVGAEAAARQDLFWEDQEQVFLSQDELRSAGDPEPVMAEIAERSHKLVNEFLQRQARQKGNGADLDPLNIGSAFLQMTAQMMSDPARLMQAHDQYGAWIHEAHHAAKKDAPSGTALSLQSIIATAGGQPVDVASTRAGFIPGTHTVGFDSAGETVTLTHAARDRTPFARGALEAAYDDACGVTAAFNRNLLVRINRELGGHFDPRTFRHQARYDEEAGRIEMHLVSDRGQRVAIDRLGLEISFQAGEAIHTENSYKYSLAEIEALAAAARLRGEHSWFDSERRFCLNLLVPG